jgi:hypothetical protein
MCKVGCSTGEEKVMEARKRGWGRILVVTIAVLSMVGPVASWAQETTPAAANAGSGPSGSTILAGVGAVLGSIFYAPFKGLILCPGVGLVAAGVTYAATGGQKETPEYLLRVGCTGTYFISPGMVQGQKAFRTFDKP